MSTRQIESDRLFAMKLARKELAAYRSTANNNCVTASSIADSDAVEAQQQQLQRYASPAHNSAAPALALAPAQGKKRRREGSAVPPCTAADVNGAARIDTRETSNGAARRRIAAPSTSLREVARRFLGALRFSRSPARWSRGHIVSSVLSPIPSHRVPNAAHRANLERDFYFSATAADGNCGFNAFLGGLLHTAAAQPEHVPPLVQHLQQLPEPPRDATKQIQQGFAQLRQLATDLEQSDTATVRDAWLGHSLRSHANVIAYLRHLVGNRREFADDQELGVLARHLGVALTIVPVDPEFALPFDQEQPLGVHILHHVDHYDLLVPRGRIDEAGREASLGVD